MNGKFAAYGIAAIVVVGGLGLAVANPELVAGLTEQLRGASASRASPGGYGLELAGVNAGTLRSFAGGAIVAPVVAETAGPSPHMKKHLAAAGPEDISLQMGLSMSPAVYEWVQSSWNGDYLRKDGALLAADYKLDVKTTREFYGALVTEFTIPAADAASKDPGYLTLKIDPESTADRRGSGKLAAEGKSQQKTWLPSNFRLTIDGLDATKVSRIESFTVRSATDGGDLGEARDYERERAPIDFPNLTIKLGEAYAESWYAWHQSFVVRGENHDAQEKNGQLEFLSANRQEVLFTVKLFNLGIFRIAPVNPESNSDTVKQVTVEMYCERMELAYGKGTLG